MTELNWQTVIDSAAHPLLLFDGDFLIECNNAAAEFLGFEKQILIGKKLFELSIEEANQLEEKLGAVSVSGPARRPSPSSSITWSFRSGKGEAIDSRVMLLPIDRDRPELRLMTIMASSTAEDAGDNLLAKVRRLEQLEKVDRAVLGASDLEEMMKGVLQTVFEIFDCDRIWLLYPADPGATSFRVPMEITRAEYPGAFAMNEDIPMGPGTREVCRHALAEPQPVVSGIKYDEAITEEILRPFAVKSRMAMAIRPRLGLPWLFGMHQCSHDRIWTDEERRIFGEIGNRISDSLSNLIFYRELKENEKKFRALSEGIFDGVMIIRGSRIVWHNNAMCKIFGREEGELAESEFCKLIGDEHYKNYEQAIAENAGINDSGKSIVEIELPQGPGEKVVVELSIGPTVFEKQDAIQVIARDITERKNTEIELAKYRTNLELLVEQRTKALETAQQELIRRKHLAAIGMVTATVSHEIRNPLGSIKNAVFAMREEIGRGDNKTLERALGLAERNIERCNNIIEELLDYTRIKKLNKERIDVDRWLHELMSEIKEPDDVRLIKKLGSGSAAEIDVNYFRRVIINLLTNSFQAFSASPEPTPAPQVIVETTAENGRVKIVISDNGQGIPDENLDQIFEPLFSTKSFGVGLGLVIVKEIVEGHDGTIEISSGEKTGARVTINLTAVR